MKKVFTILLLLSFSVILFSQEDNVKATKFKNQFVISPGITFPAGNGSNLETYNYGVAIRLGNIFYFNFLNSNLFSLGLDISYVNISYLPKNYSVEKGGFGALGLMQFGPTFAISPAEDMFLDAYFKIKPSYGIHWYSDYDVSGFESNYFDGGISIMPTFGVGFKYSVLKIGLEMETGQRNFTSYENANYYTKSIPFYTLWIGFSI
jgi:hypothetical protein